MTTADHHTPHAHAPGSTEESGSAEAPIDSPSGQVPSEATAARESGEDAKSAAATTTESGAATTTTESAAATTTESGGQQESPAHRTDLGTDESLFGDLLSGLWSRWDDVQASFVDDPRECVQKADRLVSDVVDRLTTGFAQARSHLEEQWARGEEASTEDLRQALKRYREFFHRLLSVEGTDAQHRGPE